VPLALAQFQFKVCANESCSQVVSRPSADCAAFCDKGIWSLPIACEIHSYQEYELGYRKLATTLGRASSKPAPRELELLRLLIDRRTKPVGSLGLADCLFMTAFVSIIRPRRMIEIGTGSGFSSAVLACAIDPSRSRFI
jgi:hypothetical protein